MFELLNYSKENMYANIDLFNQIRSRSNQNGISKCKEDIPPTSNSMRNY